jgi:hypothetical protein
MNITVAMFLEYVKLEVLLNCGYTKLPRDLLRQSQVNLEMSGTAPYSIHILKDSVFQCPAGCSHVQRTGIDGIIRRERR